MRQCVEVNVLLNKTAQEIHELQDMHNKYLVSALPCAEEVV